MTSIVDKFVEIYNRLDRSNISLVEEIYKENIRFIDPAHQVDGLENLKKYFEGMYENVSSCTFEVKDVLEQSEVAFFSLENDDFTQTFKRRKDPES